MTVFTRDELIELIALWKDAYRSVASGKSYAIAGRSLTYQDVDTIRAQLDDLQSELDALDGKTGSLRYIHVRTVR